MSLHQLTAAWLAGGVLVVAAGWFAARLPALPPQLPVVQPPPVAAHAPSAGPAPSLRPADWSAALGTRPAAAPPPPMAIHLPRLVSVLTVHDIRKAALDAGDGRGIVMVANGDTLGEWHIDAVSADHVSISGPGGHHDLVFGP